MIFKNCVYFVVPLYHVKVSSPPAAACRRDTGRHIINLRTTPDPATAKLHWPRSPGSELLLVNPTAALHRACLQHFSTASRLPSPSLT